MLTDRLGGLPAAVTRPMNWYLTRSRKIKGYTDRVSYLPGDVMAVHISANRPARNQSVPLETVGGEVVDTVSTSVRPQRIANDEPWTNGFGYGVTFEYRVPDLPSGVYRWDGQIPFVIRDAAPGAEMVVVYPSNTINAYNQAGGLSLYRMSEPYLERVRWKRRLASLLRGDLDPPETDPYDRRAERVSFHRPGNTTHWKFFEPFLPWLEDQPYDVSYVCDQDLDAYHTIADAELLVIVGHNEYWTREAREHFDRFVGGGGSALVLSGNTMWWQVRYDADGTQLVCYRNADDDPIADPMRNTIQWMDDRLEYPIWHSIGANFENGGYGLKDDEGWDGYRIVEPSSPLLDGVDVTKGDIIACPTQEWDGTFVIDDGPDPRPDPEALDFERLELIGYDYGTRFGEETIGTWIVFRKRPDSGVVMNVGSTDWCGERGWAGDDGAALRRITKNAIDRLLADEGLFSDRAGDHQQRASPSDT